MEITRENLIEEITKKFNEIEKLWNISDKDWKNLPDEEKQLFYAKEKEIQTDISNMIISTLPNTELFEIGEFGNLKSKKLDLALNINCENIEIERGIFETQEYKYHVIEFKEKDFEKNLFDFFEKNMNWYKRNDGVCN